MTSERDCRYCLTERATRPCLDGVECCNELVICEDCQKQRVEVGEDILCITKNKVLQKASSKALRRREEEDRKELIEQYAEEILRDYEFLQPFLLYMMMHRQECNCIRCQDERNREWEQKLIENAIEEEKKQTVEDTSDGVEDPVSYSVGDATSPHSSMGDTKEEWACSRCTFLNSVDTIRCDICHQEKEEKEQTMEDTSRGVEDTDSYSVKDSTSPHSSMEDTKEKWACSSCTFLNHIDTIRCDICKREREKLQRWVCSE